MAYSEKCVGTYIGQFTMFDPVEFNKALSEGCTVQEATRRLKGSPIVLGAAFYPLYSYAVNGVTYIRASYRLKEHFGRSAGTANLWMKGKSCTVCYDPENPGDAVVEDNAGQPQTKDVMSGGQSKSTMKWIIIAVAIFAAIRIINLIVHAFIMR